MKTWTKEDVRTWPSEKVAEMVNAYEHIVAELVDARTVLESRIEAQDNDIAVVRARLKESERTIAEKDTQIDLKKQTILELDKTIAELREKLSKADEILARTLEERNELREKLKAAVFGEPTVTVNTPTSQVEWVQGPNYAVKEDFAHLATKADVDALRELFISHLDLVQENVTLTDKSVEVVRRDIAKHDQHAHMFEQFVIRMDERLKECFTTYFEALEKMRAEVRDTIEMWSGSEKGYMIVMDEVRKLRTEISQKLDSLPKEGVIYGLINDAIADFMQGRPVNNATIEVTPYWTVCEKCGKHQCECDYIGKPCSCLECTHCQADSHTKGQWLCKCSRPWAYDLALRARFGIKWLVDNMPVGYQRVDGSEAHMCGRYEPKPAPAEPKTCDHSGESLVWASEATKGQFVCSKCKLSPAETNQSSWICEVCKMAREGTMRTTAEVPRSKLKGPSTAEPAPAEPQEPPFVAYNEAGGGFSGECAHSDHQKPNHDDLLTIVDAFWPLKKTVESLCVRIENIEISGHSLSEDVQAERKMEDERIKMVVNDREDIKALKEAQDALSKTVDETDADARIWTLHCRIKKLEESLDGIEKNIPVPEALKELCNRLEELENDSRMLIDCCPHPDRMMDISKRLDALENSTKDIREWAYKAEKRLEAMESALTRQAQGLAALEGKYERRI